MHPTTARIALVWSPLAFLALVFLGVTVAPKT